MSCPLLRVARCMIHLLCIHLNGFSFLFPHVCSPPRIHNRDQSRAVEQKETYIHT